MTEKVMFAEMRDTRGEAILVFNTGLFYTFLSIMFVLFELCFCKIQAESAAEVRGRK